MDIQIRNIIDSYFWKYVMDKKVKINDLLECGINYTVQ